MERIKSVRHKDWIALNNYLYLKDKDNKCGTTAFRCITKTCSVRGVLDIAGDNLSVKNEETIMCRPF